MFSRRSLFCCRASLVGLLPSTALFAADKPKEIRIDWATYNPVSMLLKDKGLLEKEFAKDGIKVRWVQTVSLQQGAAIPQCRLDRFRLDRRLRRAGRQDQRQPDQVDLCLFAAGMDRAGHRQGQQDHQDRGPQGQEGGDDARHRSAHLPGARAARASASPTRTSRRCWCSSTPTAAPRCIRGDVDAWAGLDPMMAQHEVEDGARLFYRKPEANTWGILNVREEFAQGSSRPRASACSRFTRRRANIRSPTTTS